MQQLLVFIGEKYRSSDQDHGQDFELVDQAQPLNKSSNSEIVCVLLDFKAERIVESIRAAFDSNCIYTDLVRLDEIKLELSSQELRRGLRIGCELLQYTRSSTACQSITNQWSAVMKHVNRRGDVYYVFQGVTKTGKPKYYVSRKAESEAGEPIDSLPDDFELFESPVDARVSIRKKVPSDIYDNELQFVQERTKLTISARYMYFGFVTLYGQATIMRPRWNRPSLMGCALCLTKQLIFWPSLKLIHYLSTLLASEFQRSAFRVLKMTQSMLGCRC